MSFVKPDRPLKSAVTALALTALLYALSAVIVTLVWIYDIKISAALAGVFLAAAALAGVYTVVNLIRHFRSSEREAFSYRLLLLFLPAVLIYAGLELYTGYLSNTADVNLNKLNNSCYKQLDENKLCERLLSGEDPESEFYTKTSAAKLLDGSIPKFRGIYTGDLATSFGSGGKVYLRLGREAFSRMKVAAMGRDSEAYLAAVKSFAKVLVKAASVSNDPDRSGEKLVNEFIDRLEQDLSMSFPNDDAMGKIGSMLFECRENFEPYVMEHVINVLQGTLTKFEGLKSSPGKIAALVDPATGKPVWSAGEVFAGNIFPAARRNRLTRDYSVCIKLLNNQRAVAGSAFSTLSSRLEQMKKNLSRCAELNAPVTLALYTDIDGLMKTTALAQTRIENALIAVEVENYRRSKKRMPSELDDIKNGLLQEIPPCHADGSKWILESGVTSSKEIASVIPGITGAVGGFIKQPGFRVYSGMFSFSILNR